MEGELGNTLNIGASAVFFVLLLIFTIHAVVLGYHWFNYGTKKKTAELAIFIYVGGGLILFAILGILLLTF